MKLPSLILLFVFIILSASPCLADGVAGAAASAASGAAAGAAGAASSGVNWDNVVDMGKTRRAMKMRELEDLVDFGGGQNQCKGSTCISRSGGTPSTKFTKTPSGALGRNVFKYGKFLNAAGKLSGWGSLAIAGVQLWQMYKDKKLQDDPALRDPLDDALGYNDDFPGEDAISQCPGGYVRVVKIQVYPPSCSKTMPSPFSGFSSCSRTQDVFRVSSKKVCADDWITVENVRYTLEPYTQENPDTDPTNPSRYPDELSDNQLKNLVNKLNDLLQKNDQLANDIADALDDIINENPEKYLDWEPFSPQEFEDGMLQGKLEDAIQQRESATDPATQKQLDDLIGRLSDRANRNELQRQRETESGQNQNDGEQQKEPEEPYNPPDIPEVELKSIDFQPIVDLQGKLMTKFPFCLLDAFGSAIDVLKADPKAPRCEINLGFGDPIIFDLSILDSFASFVRAVMSFCIFGLCGFGCFRVWSRF